MQGVVQGVGFRPTVYRLARQAGLAGVVYNGSDGVHVFFEAPNLQAARRFERLILDHLPPRAQVTRSRLSSAPDAGPFEGFRIVASKDEPSFEGLMLPPDFAMCPQCREELYDPANRRHGYAFITCTHCGPRFSIITGLPYDRPATTMADFTMCADCKQEYTDPMDRRYHSQTNSCPQCPIHLFLHPTDGPTVPLTDLQPVIDLWNDGKIVAIKGIGGYLLTCDATRPEVVARLRRRKHRPAKPFALMYHDIEVLAEDVHLDICARLMLQSPEAPIVLLTVKDDPLTPLALDDIAPGLHRIGVMLPYTPLYDLLLRRFGKPIVATSGNPTNATIVFDDDEALQTLPAIADAIVSNDRPIAVPQDDSVVAITPLHRHAVIYRRSRGLAPAHFDASLQWPPSTVLAMGALLKSTFTLLHHRNLFISQYLGATHHYEAQQNYRRVLDHFLSLLKARPAAIIVDKHPDYFPTQLGQSLATEWDVPLVHMQHHQAHFYAILAESGLLASSEPVLGVIWDGTGLGDDGHIWGGEFFTYQDGRIERMTHLPYFPFILGDKMPREPRISALALSTGNAKAHPFLQRFFTDEEWRIYQTLLSAGSRLQTSSIGRLFDGVAALVLGISHQTYEGEAAMQLERAADAYFREHGLSMRYAYLADDKLPDNFTAFLLEAVLTDLQKGYAPEFISARFHLTLVRYIAAVAQRAGIRHLAFSGGVFQNTWLVDLLVRFLGKEFRLYFHRRLSPNDENVSFGQLVGHLHEKGELKQLGSARPTAENACHV